MEKIVRTYAETLCRDGGLHVSQDGQEVDSRNPEQFDCNENVLGFRFYNQDFIVDSNRTYVGDKSDYSNWYYFGDRMSLEDMTRTCSDNESLIDFIIQYGISKGSVALITKNMERDNVDSICVFRNHAVVMNESDITMSEYVSSKKKCLIK